MKENGARMEKFARLMGVPFMFNIIHHSGDLSTLDFNQLDLASEQNQKQNQELFEDEQRAAGGAGAERGAGSGGDGSGGVSGVGDCGSPPNPVKFSICSTNEEGLAAKVAEEVGVVEMRMRQRLGEGEEEGLPAKKVAEEVGIVEMRMRQRLGKGEEEGLAAKVAEDGRVMEMRMRQRLGEGEEEGR